MEKNNSKPLIIANWKMYKTISEANNWLEKFLSYSRDNVEIVVAAPYTLLGNLREKIKHSSLSIAAQDCSDKALDQGAFTGDISAAMLKDIGCEYVIIGHSERRKYHHEQNKIIRQKVELALKVNLKVILCVGENLAQRESGNYLEFVWQELLACLPERIDLSNVIFAYEPIWAIGTGKSATIQQIEEMHSYLNEHLNNLLKNTTQLFEKNAKIVYGGSVTEENSSSILSCNHVAGLLVGGASLDAERFYKIIKNL